jgi:flagellar protein FlaI
MSNNNDTAPDSGVVTSDTDETLPTARAEDDLPTSGIGGLPTARADQRLRRHVAEPPIDEADPPAVITDEDFVPPETTDMPPEDIRAAILREVKEYFEQLAAQYEAGDATHGEERWFDFARETLVPTDEFIETRWFDFGYLDQYEQVDRYWVNKPFAYVTVLYDREGKSFRYHVTEPVLNPFEQYAKDDLVRVVRNSLMYEAIETTDDREALFATKVSEIVDDHAATVDVGTVHKLIYYLFRDFLDFGHIDPLMRDPDIEDISCDGAGVPVFVYHCEFRDLRTNVVFEGKPLNSLTVRLAQRAGKHISVSNPLVDASLPDGSRIQLTLGTDVSARGSNFTIRKFADIPYSPVDMINWNTFDVDQLAYLWLAIENNRSLVIAGGTGSGKTTAMNAVSFFIPPDSKVVSIEDTREITLPHDNWIQGTTRPSATADGRGEIGTYELLQASLRQRPEYILVGEIRTEPKVALTFFQAIGTGHTAYSTFHADSVESFLSRLENPPLGVPAQMIQDLDIVCIQKQVFQGDQRVRRNVRIAEITRGDSHDSVETYTVFERDPRTDEFVQKNDSLALRNVAELRGWSDEDLASELANRRTVLAYLVDNEITDYRAVASTIHMFARDPEYVLGLVERDELDPTSFPSEA